MIKRHGVALVVAFSFSAGFVLAQDAKKPAHEDFSLLLGRYVDAKGLVDYKTWKAKDTAALDAYLARLATLDESKLEKNEKIALWLNAHNAITVRAVLEFHPIASIKDKVSHAPWGYNLWKEYKKAANGWSGKIAGRDLSLDEIVNEVLRKLGEPRVHFAISWAANGSPLLRGEAYEASKLEEQLEDQVQKFLADPRQFKLDPDDQEACVGEVIKWYAEDFGADESKQIAWLATHVKDEATKKFLANPKTSFEWLDFDWSLNEKH